MQLLDKSIEQQVRASATHPLEFCAKSRKEVCNWQIGLEVLQYSIDYP